jgi:hypothetical protein
LAGFPLNKLDRIIEFTSITTLTVKGSNLIPMRIGDNWLLIDTDTVVSTAADMDAGAIANGLDYFVYACDNAGTLEFKISLVSTWPAGFTAATSRKIGGFHTLCTNVGAIGGHPLTGYVAKNILPQSVWDLKHRPISEPAGMVFSAAIQGWVDIYLASGNGAATASVNGAVISDTRDWNDFVDDFGAVKKKLLDDSEFQLIAAGSNEETNIAGGADPVTTGGHVDTAARRMISNIGCEDCCGVLYQWMRDQSFKSDFVTGWDWYNLPGAKGSLYNQDGVNGRADVKLFAGGCWTSGVDCGSRSRHATNSRWTTAADLGGRGWSRKL